ncbi:Tetratricopeptide repeat-containing protein [Sphingopyxis sp. YR583]|jgi:D-alanyl-D-alanine carboxypeptidase|uniref:SPOR domain-containing protein n=1 Tax=Sphingopyxis sp. YR583 TaxID=1881047 RepID=UPI0008A7F42F|nr:SPOR domain-containing protein [Sphingopyxis sp. YR583]SEH18900.1 Tetratricopeptide repeat-containing protein [Sphingopyxis sp. YR583]
MNRKMLKNLAFSGFILGVATGCSGMGKMADAPSRAAGKPVVAAKSADQARVALEAGKPSKAVSLAEAAVAASPRDAGYRTLLGQAYLGNGRFASATTALTEAMELGANDSNTILSLALAQIAQNKNQQAIALLTQHRDAVPASDLGLALALAGDAEGSLYVLNEASRAKDADARTRQNFALALALSGRWAQARMIASQDLSLAKLEGRMAEWSKLAEQPNAQVRVASLMGTTAREDAGMPVRLALNNFSDTQMAAAEPAVQLASADPAPVADYAPPPPVLADASSAIRSVELPMPARNAEGAVPVTELPQPKPASEVIMADAAPYRAAPRVAGEGRIRPAQKQAMELATVLVPKAMGFDAKKPAGWAVQLGAYDSLGIAKEKWGVLKKRNGVLGNFPASSHAATVNGRNFYRLTVNGLATRADATSLCNQLKAQGQTCFVRAMGGGEAIQWASKAGPMRLASR